MAFFSGKMLEIALELAQYDDNFEDIALRYLREYIQIAKSINQRIDQGGLFPHGASYCFHDQHKAAEIIFDCLTLRWAGLWDPEEGFYFDRLTDWNAVHHPLKIISMVGLVPLFAATQLKADVVARFPELRAALQTAAKNTKFVSIFLSNECAKIANIICQHLSKLPKYLSKSQQRKYEKLKIFRCHTIWRPRSICSVLPLMNNSLPSWNMSKIPVNCCLNLESDPFPRYSGFQVEDRLRARMENLIHNRTLLILNQKRENNPFCLSLERSTEAGLKTRELHCVSYCPGESNSTMFGGNSNWRGPIWICSELFFSIVSTNF